MTLTGKNYVGASRSARGVEKLSAIDPKTGGELPGSFSAATEEELEEIMALSRNAYDTYSRLGGAAKAKFLRAIGEEILAKGDALVERAVMETSLPPQRIVSERGRTIGQLNLFADLIEEGSWCEATIDTADPNRYPIPKPDLRRMLVAMGPVVVFAASNFPLAFSTAGGDTASALAGGNPVIVKAHSSHMGTSELVASAIIEAARKTGMPDGVFSMVFGGGRTVGQALVTHPYVKAASFTGSEVAGRILFNIAAGRPDPIPFFAEMGSLNPVVLLPMALKRRAKEIAEALSASMTLGCGQFCTKPGLLIAEKSTQLDDFISHMGSCIEKIPSVTMLNPAIHASFNRNVALLLEKKSVEISSQSDAEPDAAAHEARPILLITDAAKFLSDSVLRQEIFGPYALLVRCEDKDQIKGVLEILEGQLTTTVYAEQEELTEDKKIVKILREKAGRMIHNGVSTGVEVCSAMQHGGPYPASTDARFTSVGTSAIKRFTRPVSYQNWPRDLLPEELKTDNPIGLWRLVDNKLTKDEA